MWPGETILLRPVTADDLDDLETWNTDPALRGEYNQFGLVPSGRVRRGFTESNLLDDDRGTLIVCTPAGERIGTTDYRRVSYGGGVSNRAYQIGIALLPQHRGHGYGSAAQRLLAAYLFATYAVERVEATTDVTNVAEQRALVRAGFAREGCYDGHNGEAGHGTTSSCTVNSAAND